MSNPYLIAGPALISFSGGRTSGYMLHQIVHAYGGALPDDVKVVFANTGKEREETLRFVHECATQWGVNVRWVEWRENAEGFEEVGYNSASRNGEPFEALIRKKGMPPNWQARFCTQFLKVHAMTCFARSLEWARYTEVIGLRDDEGHRILKGLARAEEDGRHVAYPLAKSKVRKPDVMAFWGAQKFDLALPPGAGNCDLCFLKSMQTRRALMRQWPGSADWWMAQERSTNGFFDRRALYVDLDREVRTQGHLFDGFMPDEEYDAECGLVCG